MSAPDWATVRPGDRLEVVRPGGGFSVVTVLETREHDAGSPLFPRPVIVLLVRSVDGEGYEVRRALTQGRDVIRCHEVSLF